MHLPGSEISTDSEKRFQEGRVCSSSCASGTEEGRSEKVQRKWESRASDRSVGEIPFSLVVTLENDESEKRHTGETTDRAS